MKHSKFSIAIIVALLVLAAFAIFSGLNAENETTNKAKIGIILPLTGDLADLGNGAKNGALLAFKNLPAKSQAGFQILWEDDAFDPRNTTTAFQKLVELDNVDAVVCFTSNPCNAVANLAEKKQVPLIAIASDSTIAKNRKFVFRLEISPSEEAKTLAEFIKESKFQRIAAITAVQDGIKADFFELSKHQEYSSVQVFHEETLPNERDYRTVLSKALAKNPDTILVGLLPGNAGEFGKQAQELGFKGRFIGFNFIEGPETLTAAQGSLEGMVFTNSDDFQGWFNQAYLGEFGKNPSPGSAHLYDALTLFSQAEQESKTSNVLLVRFFENRINYEGALGTFSSTGSHEFSLPVTLKTIKNNEFVKLEN